MKNEFALGCSLLLLAGCAHDRRAAHSEKNFAEPAYSTTTTTSPETGVTTAPRESQVTSSVAAQRQDAGTGDAILITQVQERIKNSPALSSVAPSVQVMAQHGTVTLTGTIANESEKQMVAALVQNTSGVTTVDNQLQVALSPTSRRPNESSRIYSNATDRASGAVAKDAAGENTVPAQTTSPTTTTDSILAELAANQVAPSTATQAGLGTNGQQGASPSLYTTGQSQSAVTAAVSSFTNQIPTPTSQRPNDVSRIYSTAPTAPAASVPPEPAPEARGLDIQASTQPDRTLAKKIAEDLHGDSTIAGEIENVKIQLDNGKAILRGKVHSEAEKVRITAAIEGVAGVTSVQNLMEIGTPAPGPVPNAKD